MLCTRCPNPVLGVEVSNGVRWHKKHLPSSMHNSQSQCLGCGQAAHVTMNQTPPSLSLPSTNPSSKHKDDRLVWNTPGLGIDHRRLGRTRGGLHQVAAPHSLDMFTVTEVAPASSRTWDVSQDRSCTT